MKATHVISASLSVARDSLRRFEEDTTADRSAFLAYLLETDPQASARMMESSAWWLDGSELSRNFINFVRHQCCVGASPKYSEIKLDAKYAELHAKLGQMLRPECTVQRIDIKPCSVCTDLESTPSIRLDLAVQLGIKTTVLDCVVHAKLALSVAYDDCTIRLRTFSDGCDIQISNVTAKRASMLKRVVLPWLVERVKGGLCTGITKEVQICDVDRPSTQLPGTHDAEADGMITQMEREVSPPS